MEETRADRWLWAVRLFKTRTQARDACRSGRVRVNGARVKPAATVRPGDRVEVRRPGGDERIVEVVRVVGARVGPSLAADCFLDRTPAAPPSQAPAVPRRERGSGRPSKRERRELDQLRGRRSR